MTLAVPAELIKQDMNSYLHGFLRLPHGRRRLFLSCLDTVNQPQCAEIAWGEVIQREVLTERTNCFIQWPAHWTWVLFFPMMPLGNGAGESEAAYLLAVSFVTGTV